MKRLLVLVVGLTLAFVVAAVGLHLWWVWSAPVDERRTIVWPGGGASASSRPITVEMAPDLAAAGVTHVGGGGGEEVDVQVFLRVEKPHLEVKLAANKGPLPDTNLTYTLFDGDGTALGTGTVPLDGTLAPERPRSVTIRDARLFEAQRVVFQRQSKQ